LSLAVKGFNEDRCIIKASALTYYTLFSIVPVVALIFAIAKGFNFEKKLQEQLLNDFNEHSAVLNQVFMYADSMLQTTRGGIIAGFGVVVLLWSVMKLLGNIEDSFNEIWEIKKSRSFVRKITDYLSIMLIAPVFLILSGSATVIIKTQIGNAMAAYEWLQHAGPAFALLVKLVSWFLICGLFTFLYLVLPNTKVNFSSALMAGLVAALLFEVTEWAYITFQIGVAQYNAIYGSFAALPLFLLWLQTSWYIVLFGAEISFANQNVDHYELENEIQNISPQYKKVLSLLVVHKVVKQFVEQKPALKAQEIAEQLDLPIRLARSIIFDFTETGIFSEVKIGEEKEVAYQPAVSDNELSIKYVLDALDKKGVNEIPIQNQKELDSIHSIMQRFDSLLVNCNENILIRNIK
jgi:membrane protein